MDDNTRLKIHETVTIDYTTLIIREQVSKGKNGRIDTVSKRMTVEGLRDLLAQYPPDAEVSMNESDYWSSSGSSSQDGQLSINWIRDETDEEYETRVRLQKQQAANARAARRELNQKAKQAELDLLKKLLNKHGTPKQDKV